VSTTVGEAAKTEIKNISFDDEEAIAKLEELQSAYPGAEIYLSGELTIDFPEDVKIPIEPNQMVTAELVGSSLKLNYCDLENAIVILNAQYTMGAVEIKVVHLKSGT
jgi:inner membrane protein